MVIEMTLKQFVELYNSELIRSIRFKELVEITPEEVLIPEDVKTENQEPYSEEHFDPSSGF